MPSPSPQPAALNSKPQPCSLPCSNGDTMRVRIIAVAVLMLAVVGVSTRTGVAQNPSGATYHSTRPELALGYSYLRSNAPPGGCTCFNLNGGNATFAWPLKAGHFALAGDITAAQSSGISSGGYSLTLAAYT